MPHCCPQKQQCVLTRRSGSSPTSSRGSPRGAGQNACVMARGVDGELRHSFLLRCPHRGPCEALGMARRQRGRCAGSARRGPRPRNETRVRSTVMVADHHGMPAYGRSQRRQRSAVLRGGRVLCRTRRRAARAAEDVEDSFPNGSHSSVTMTVTAWRIGNERVPRIPSSTCSSWSA